MPRGVWVSPVQFCWRPSMARQGFYEIFKAVENGVEIGFCLCQVNKKMNRRTLLKSGIDTKIFKSIPVQSTFVSTSNIAKFRYMLMQTEDTLQLQWEVLSQQYATFEIVARKLKDLTTYSKEEYYWTVMNTFYGLQIKEEDRLPAYFVLRDFLEQYLCEHYALYFNQKCKCVQCISVIISD